MAKKNTSTSRLKSGGVTKCGHHPKQVKLSDGSTAMQEYGNQIIHKRVYKKKVPDAEAAPPPKDDAAKFKYPPPKNNALFRKKWMGFVKGLISRESFKEAHLDALEVLCDLYVEYAELEKIIRTEGRTYKTVSQQGESIKMHPAVGQLDKVRHNIRAYTMRLDLFPKKDNTSDADGEDEAWA